MYRKGQGVERNSKLGARWTAMAKEQRDKEIAAVFARMHKDGDGKGGHGVLEAVVGGVNAAWLKQWWINSWGAVLMIFVLGSLFFVYSTVTRLSSRQKRQRKQAAMQQARLEGKAEGREETKQVALAEKVGRKKEKDEARRKKEQSKRLAEEQAQRRKTETAKREAEKNARRGAAESAKRVREERQAVERRQKEKEKEKERRAKAVAAQAKEVMDARRDEARGAEEAQKRREDQRKSEVRRHQAAASREEKTRKEAVSAAEVAERVRKEAELKSMLGPSGVTDSVSSSSASSSSSSRTFSVGSVTVYTHSVLGEGSCGTQVYKGLWQGREVAVKVMLKDAVPEHRARREMKLLQDLAESTGRGRDHVIQYRCMEEMENKVLLCMELCECSLHDVISVQQQRVPLVQQLRIVRELSEAVAFLHEHQIVHRDVRPRNVLFKQGGFEGIVKLTDFGLSRGLDYKNLDKSFTTTTAQAGTEIGSFGYYAPEVYRREKPTAKVDVFSLGCCVFYVFSNGANPFQDEHDPDNKFLLNNNILSGRSNLLAPIIRAHGGKRLPEAVDLVASMVDIEVKVRLSMVQVLAHPLFWSAETRFQFLCAVGKEEDVMCGSVVARTALPPSMVPRDGWRDTLDIHVWAHYTIGDLCRSYDSSSTTHLLRFLRNCEAHPPPHDSAAQAVLAGHGGMASYFTLVFPELTLRVWTALAEGDGWCTRGGLTKYLAQSSRTRSVVAVPPQQMHPLSLLQTTAPTVADGELKQWLMSIHPAFATYAAALNDYGYEDLSFLRQVDESDFGEALTAVGMTKQGHRALALRRFLQLKKEQQ
jgi:serine/threonine protein kinase